LASSPTKSNLAYRFPIVKPHALELVEHIG
jgi:hypothetical protein